jgi:hypothetical protein
VTKLKTNKDFLFKKILPVRAKNMINKMIKKMDKLEDDFSILSEYKSMKEDPIGQYLIDINFQCKSKYEIYDKIIEKQGKIIRKILDINIEMDLEKINFFLNFFVDKIELIYSKNIGEYLKNIQESVYDLSTFSNDYVNTDDEITEFDMSDDETINLNFNSYNQMNEFDLRKSEKIENNFDKNIVIEEEGFLNDEKTKIFDDNDNTITEQSHIKENQEFKKYDNLIHVQLKIISKILKNQIDTDVFYNLEIIYSILNFFEFKINKIYLENKIEFDNLFFQKFNIKIESDLRFEKTFSVELSHNELIETIEKKNLEIESLKNEVQYYKSLLIKNNINFEIINSEDEIVNTTKEIINTKDDEIINENINSIEKIKDVDIQNYNDLLNDFDKIDISNLDDDFDLDYQDILTEINENI